MSVYLKLVKIQSELKAPKSQRNSFGNYNYRNCEDILEALKPILAENKAIILLSDKIVKEGDRYYVEATATLIDAESGERIDVNGMAREEENKKGMDSSQLTGSTSSYARKYALNGLFAIDDTKDSDTTNTYVKEDKKASTDNKTSSNNSSNKASSNKITDAQKDTLYKMAYSKGFKFNQVDELILQRKGKAIADLTKEEYEPIFEYYKGLNKN